MTQRSPDKETPNEDVALIADLGNSVVLAIADGAGGYANGRDAALLQMDFLQQSLLDHTALTAAEVTQNILRNAIIDAIENCNTQLISNGRGAATTVAVAIISDGTLRTFHVGDSSILLTGQRGRLKYQTVGHANISLGIEAGILDPGDAVTHPDRHYLTNYVGNSQMRIEVGSEIPLAKLDTLLLCSDGLNDNVGTEEIIDHVRCGDLTECLTSLIQQCEDAMASADGHCDDLTMILVRSRVSTNALPKQT